MKMVRFHFKVTCVIALCYLMTLFLIYKCIPLNHSNSMANSQLHSRMTNGTDFSRILNDKQWREEDTLLFKKIPVKEAVEIGSLDDKWCDPARPSRFVQVDGNVYLYSAFLDNRKHSERASVRVVAAVAKGITKEFLNTKLVCVFEMNYTVEVSVQLQSYEMCENHKKKFGGWIFSCQLPNGLNPQIPDRIKISFASSWNTTNNKLYAEVCVTSRDKYIERRKLSFGVCVPPIYGTVTAKQLIEFIEFNRILGADIFTLYETDDIYPDVKRVIHYYKDLNVVNTIPWRLPFPVDSIWYYGQSLAINDCLYRNMQDFKYLTFVDLDEFIIPQGNMTTWNDVINDINATNPETFKNASGFSFKSTFYANEFSRHVFSNEMSMVVRTNRTKHFSYRRHKLIVKPQVVFELGIHHVSKPLIDDVSVKVINVPTLKAHIHHYRSCVQEFGIHCQVRIEDYRVPNVYGKQIIDNYLRTVFDITP